MKTLLLLSFLTFYTPPKYYYVDSELEEVVLDVVEDLKEGGIWPGFPQRVIFRMSDGIPKGREIAIAYGTNHDYGIFITVYRKRYNKLTANQKKYVILHEIGHDVYNLSHSTTITAMNREVPNYMPDSYIRHTVKDFIRMIKRINKRTVGRSK